MKYIQDNVKVGLLRKTHIAELENNGYVANFDKKKLRILMSNHVEVLQNYLLNFGKYLRSYYTLSSRWKRYKLKRILGKYRLFEIMALGTDKAEESIITINEVFKLYRTLNLKKDFERYFVGKTNLSYTLFKKHPIEAIIFKKFKKLKTEEDIVSFFNQGNKLSDPRNFSIKVAQFVHCIMAEYIVLNNLMFASGYKLDFMNTTDSWLKDLKKVI